MELLTTRMARQMVLTFILGSERRKPAWRAGSLGLGAEGCLPLQQEPTFPARPARPLPQTARQRVACPRHSLQCLLLSPMCSRAPPSEASDAQPSAHWPSPRGMCLCLTPLASAWPVSLLKLVGLSLKQGLHLRAFASPELGRWCWAHAVGTSRPQSTAVERLGSRPRLPGSQSWPRDPPPPAAVQLQVNHLVPLCLSSLIWKMGVTIASPSQSCWAGRAEQ